MNPNDTTTPVWRVTYHGAIGVYYVEGIGCFISSHDSVIRDGLTYVEALALARLLNAGVSYADT